MGLTSQKMGVHRKSPTFASLGEAGLESMLIFTWLCVDPAYLAMVA